MLSKEIPKALLRSKNFDKNPSTVQTAHISNSLNTNFTSILDSRVPKNNTFHLVSKVDDYGLNKKLVHSGHFKLEDTSEGGKFLSSRSASKTSAFKQSDGIPSLSKRFNEIAPDIDYRYTDPQYYEYRLKGMTQDKLIQNRWLRDPNDADEDPDKFDPTNRALNIRAKEFANSYMKTRSSTSEPVLTSSEVGSSSSSGGEEKTEAPIEKITIEKPKRKYIFSKPALTPEKREEEVLKMNDRIQKQKENLTIKQAEENEKKEIRANNQEKRANKEQAFNDLSKQDKELILDEKMAKLKELEPFEFDSLPPKGKFYYLKHLWDNGQEILDSQRNKLNLKQQQYFLDDIHGEKISDLKEYNKAKYSNKKIQQIAIEDKKEKQLKKGEIDLEIAKKLKEIEQQDRKDRIRLQKVQQNKKIDKLREQDKKRYEEKRRRKEEEEEEEEYYEDEFEDSEEEEEEKPKKEEEKATEKGFVINKGFDYSKNEKNIKSHFEQIVQLKDNKGDKARLSVLVPAKLLKTFKSDHISFREDIEMGALVKLYEKVIEHYDKKKPKMKPTPPANPKKKQQESFPLLEDNLGGRGLFNTQSDY